MDPSDNAALGRGPRAVSRRGLLIAGAASVAVLGSVGVTDAATARALDVSGSARSRTRAYAFLNERVDDYGHGKRRRLPRSYLGGHFPADYVSSFAYDDALVILAYLARGLPRDIRRATALGDALLYLQANDPIGDGRTRASYQPDNFPLRTPRRPLDIGSRAAYTGNQAWVGMAFARLFAVTRRQRFLTGALRLGRWIEHETLDTERAPHGYTGGRNGQNVAATHKGTEHNIDVTGFFTQLADLTGDDVWRRRAAVAASFVRAMQAPDGHLWAGTIGDGATINRGDVPEDVQTWAYLATREHRYARSVTWVVRNLIATDGHYTGPSFSDVDTSKVWFEGTGHLALALRERDASGDRARAGTLLATLRRAQRRQPNGDGRGVVAASRDGLRSGFGDRYYASLHTGATAWYLLALAGSNPFRLTAAERR